jgi:hypothetical protein
LDYTPGVRQRRGEPCVSEGSMSVEPETAAIVEHLKTATPMELMTIEQLPISIVPPNLSARKPVRRIEDRSIADGIPVRILRTAATSGRISVIERAEALDSGHGNEDFTSIMKLVEERCGRHRTEVSRRLLKRRMKGSA